MSDPQTPRTKAGRRLLDKEVTTATRTGIPRGLLMSYILAIEAESGSVELDDEQTWQPHPGENHEFRTICRRCGEPGTLHVALIAPGEVVRIEEYARLVKDTGDSGSKP